MVLLLIWLGFRRIPKDKTMPRDLIIILLGNAAGLDLYLTIILAVMLSEVL